MGESSTKYVIERVGSQRYVRLESRGRARILIEEWFYCRRNQWRRSLRSLNRHVRTIWLEIRSLLPRIQASKSKMLVEGLQVGNSLERDRAGNPILSKSTNARIHDIRLLGQANPWLSPMDCWLFLQGWEKGSEWAVRQSRHPDSCSKLQATDATSGQPNTFR